ncbi:MAG: hypothetical protein JW797_08875 [Bradymonadales bacterium]|nr:hypothetical protein [Bradymonadales bacterium]
MRTKPPNATGKTALMSLALVCALARVAFAQEAEPSSAEGSAPAVEATAQDADETGPADQQPAEDVTPQTSPVADETTEQQLPPPPEMTPGTTPVVDETAGQTPPTPPEVVDQPSGEPVSAEPPAQDAPEVSPPPAEAFPLASALSQEEEEGLEVESRLPASIEQAERFWQVLGLYELHFNLISDDYSANDWTSYYMLRGNYDITQNNQIGLRLDLDQRYIADPGESGLWFGDIRLYYTRFFTLPIPDFPIPARAIAYLTAPTSRVSQERSIITQPTATLRLIPSYGPFTLVADYTFRYTFARYAESSHGATPNNMMTTGFMFWLVYNSPLEWFWPSVLWQSTWSKNYSTRENDWQPWLEDYYFEGALNFTLPLPDGYPTAELSLAYAQGASVLEDGVYRLYFAKRDQSQIYFGLSLTY